jgi:hypothetical protein
VFVAQLSKHHFSSDKIRVDFVGIEMTVLQQIQPPGRLEIFQASKKQAIL